MQGIVFADAFRNNSVNKFIHTGAAHTLRHRSSIRGRGTNVPAGEG
jgi:hypothetical protein